MSHTPLPSSQEQETSFCFVFSLHWLFQVVAKAGKKQRINVCSRALSDPNPQRGVNLSFLVPQDGQWPTRKAVKLARCWPGSARGEERHFFITATDAPVVGVRVCFQPVKEAERRENYFSTTKGSAACRSVQPLGCCIHVVSLVSCWNCQSTRNPTARRWDVGV